MDFNSRYKNADNSLNTMRPNTIRTNAGGYDSFDDMDIMEAESRQKNRQVSRASAARGSSSRGRKARKQMLVYLIIIAVEIIILALIWILHFTVGGGSSSSSSKSSKAESSSDSGAASGSINVDNDSFSLTCTKISINTDAAGNPVALIRFTFVNKTDVPLSMAQVFAPSFSQGGSSLSAATALADEPAELYNKDTQIANGESVECVYSASLIDTKSEITITIHDNYETFSDIGSQAVPIS